MYFIFLVGHVCIFHGKLWSVFLNISVTHYNHFPGPQKGLIRFSWMFLSFMMQKPYKTLSMEIPPTFTSLFKQGTEALICLKVRAYGRDKGWCLFIVMQWSRNPSILTVITRLYKSVLGGKHLYLTPHVRKRVECLVCDSKFV